MTETSKAKAQCRGVHIGLHYDAHSSQKRAAEGFIGCPGRLGMQIAFGCVHRKTAPTSPEGLSA